MDEFYNENNADVLKKTSAPLDLFHKVVLFANPHENMSKDDVESLLVSLSYHGYMRGYILTNQYVYRSKKLNFPNPYHV